MSANQNSQQGSDSAPTSDRYDIPLLIKKKSNAADIDAQPSFLSRLLRKLKFVPLVMLFGAFVGTVALYFQPPGLQMLMRFLELEPGGGTQSPIAVPAPPQPPTGAAVKPQIRLIVGLGKLLPEGDVRTVAPPFGAGDARIAELLVDEGSKVIAGQRLAVLDNQQSLKAAIDNATSTVSVRRATLDQVKNSVLISQDEAKASLQRAESALENSIQEFDRTEALFKRGFTTNSILDQKRSTRDQARGEVQRLTATLARYSAKSIDHQPDVVVAARNLDAAISDLNRTKSDLSKSIVNAPSSGVVLQIHVRAGEKPGAKGILDIGNIEKMTADVEIYQTEIGSVSLGAKVELTAEALSVPLQGIVTKIGLEVGGQELIDATPAANTDARVVIVSVALDKVSSEAAKRYTNLQVLARIEALPR